VLYHLPALLKRQSGDFCSTACRTIINLLLIEECCTRSVGLLFSGCKYGQGKLESSANGVKAAVIPLRDGRDGLKRWRPRRRQAPRRSKERRLVSPVRQRCICAASILWVWFSATDIEKPRSAIPLGLACLLAYGSSSFGRDRFSLRIAYYAVMDH